MVAETELMLLHIFLVGRELVMISCLILFVVLGLLTRSRGGAKVWFKNSNSLDTALIYFSVLVFNLYVMFCILLELNPGPA